MRGWLVVNGFLHSRKFEEIYALLCKAFTSRGITLEIRPNDGELAVVASADSASTFSGTSTGSPGFVLFWDKDIPLAWSLENRGWRLFNPAMGISLCDDKAMTALALENAGVVIPKTVVAPLKFGDEPYPSLAFLDQVASELGFPMVFKARKGSFGEQVFLVHEMSELRVVLRNASARHPQSGWVFQEFISSSFGRDIRIQTLGDEVVASVLRRGGEGNFRSNVTIGGRMEAFDPPSEFIDAALKSTRTLGLDFAGVDLMFGGNGEPVVCEVNSNAHFKSLLDATGVNFADLLAEYVPKALARRAS